MAETVVQRPPTWTGAQTVLLNTAGLTWMVDQYISSTKSALSQWWAYWWNEFSKVAKNPAQVQKVREKYLSQFSETSKRGFSCKIINFSAPPSVVDWLKKYKIKKAPPPGFLEVFPEREQTRAFPATSLSTVDGSFAYSVKANKVRFGVALGSKCANFNDVNQMWSEQFAENLEVKVRHEMEHWNTLDKEFWKQRHAAYMANPSGFQEYQKSEEDWGEWVTVLDYASKLKAKGWKREDAIKQIVKAYKGSGVAPDTEMAAAAYDECEQYQFETKYARIERLVDAVLLELKTPDDEGSPNLILPAGTKLYKSVADDSWSNTHFPAYFWLEKVSALLSHCSFSANKPFVVIAETTKDLRLFDVAYDWAFNLTGIDEFDSEIIKQLRLKGYSGTLRRDTDRYRRDANGVCATDTAIALLDGDSVNVVNVEKKPVRH